MARPRIPGACGIQNMAMRCPNTCASSKNHQAVAETNPLRKEISMSIQFTKIKPQRSDRPVKSVINRDIGYQGKCKYCQTREVAGYIGSGVCLIDSCAKCYRARGIESKGEAKSARFYNLEGRS